MFVTLRASQCLKQLCLQAASLFSLPYSSFQPGRRDVHRCPQVPSRCHSLAMSSMYLKSNRGSNIMNGALPSVRRPCCLVAIIIIIAHSLPPDSELIYLQLPKQPTVILDSAQAAFDLFEKRANIYSDRHMAVIDEM